MVNFHCNHCGAQAEGRLGRVYNLPPIGWFEEHQFKAGAAITGRYACEASHVTPGAETYWKEISGPKIEREKVGQEHCSWCRRIRKMCPAHAK